MELDIAQFKHKMDERIHNTRIEWDRESGWNSGVREIPTLFINDIRYDGDLTMAAIMNVIESE